MSFLRERWRTFIGALIHGALPLELIKDLGFYKQLYLQQMQSSLKFPFRRSFYLFSVRAGSAMVVAGDGALSALRLALVLAGVQLVAKEHCFINMDLFESRIRYSILFGVNILACVFLGVGIWMSERRPWPVLMVPWLVMFLCSTWLYYPNVIYHSKAVWLIVLCVTAMVICLYCWCVVLSHFLEVLDGALPRRLRSDETNVTVTAA